MFSEQVSSDLTVQTVSDNFRKVAAQIKSMFPTGLPQSFDDLSEDQKTVIARAGGDAISFILRNTDMLYKVVPNDQVEDQLIDKVSAWAKTHPASTTPPPAIENIIFNIRENLALDQINDYFNANPTQQDVILIYGSDHYYSLLTHSAKFPSQCIVVPKKFQTAITSPYGQYGTGGYQTNSPPTSPAGSNSQAQSVP